MKQDKKLKKYSNSLKSSLNPTKHFIIGSRIEKVSKVLDRSEKIPATISKHI